MSANGVTDEPQGAAATGRARPWWLCALAIAVALPYWTTPIRDIDTYWHVLVGRTLMAGGGAAGDPAMTYGPFNESWRTTQWASEVLMAGLQAGLDWKGLVLMRLVGGTVAIVVAFLAIVSRTRQSPAPAVLFVGVLIVVVPNVLERPTLLVMPLVIGAGVALRDVLTRDRWLPGWSFAAVVWIWSALHGSWALAWALWVGASILEARRWPARVTAIRLGWAMLAGLLVMVSPAGSYVWVSQVAIPAAARVVGLTEWNSSPTMFGLPGALATSLTIGVVVLLLWRFTGRPRLLEIAVALALLFGCWTAIRLIPVAALLAAPTVAWRLDLAWVKVHQRVAARGVFQKLSAIAAAGHRWLTGAAIAILAVAVGISGVRLAALDPLTEGTPDKILRAIAATPDATAVYNDYNLGGRFQVFTPAAVVVDGRADRYPLDFLSARSRAESGDPRYVDLPERLKSTDAVLDANTPLAGVLQQRGWTVHMRDRAFIWLRAPKR